MESFYPGGYNVNGEATMESSIEGSQKTKTTSMI